MATDGTSRYCPRGIHRGSWDHDSPPLDRLSDGSGWACPGVALDGSACGYELHASPSAGEPTYTRAEIKANLVTKGMIAARTGVGYTAVHGWATRYADWPEPIVDGALPGGRQHKATGGRQAVYWWPEVQAFLARHRFPRPAPRPRTNTDTKHIPAPGRYT